MERCMLKSWRTLPHAKKQINNAYIPNATLKILQSKKTGTDAPAFLLYCGKQSVRKQRPFSY